MFSSPLSLAYPSLPPSLFLPVKPFPMPSPFKLIWMALPLFSLFASKILWPTDGTKCPPLEKKGRNGGREGREEKRLSTLNS